MTMIKHLSFPAQDGIVLQALVYTGTKPTKRLAIFVHGAGSSSILNNPELTNLLAQALEEQGVDFMSFNNRGAGYITKLRKAATSPAAGGTSYGGMAYERIADSVYDIEGALEWADHAGYTTFYLIGHSTGANKLCLYLSRTKIHRGIKRAFLIAGGDDITLQRARLADPAKVEALIDRALQAGKGDQLVPAAVFPGEHPISFASFKELITEHSDYDMFPFGRYEKNPGAAQYFQQFKSITTPLTVLYGERDFGTVIPPSSAATLLKSLNPHTDYYVIPQADHNFTGHEDDLAAQIVAGT